MPGPGTVLWVWCVALCSFTRLNFAPINTLSLFVSCIVPLWTANSFYVSFLFRLVCFVTSVSLHMYFVMRVCWFVCLSLMLRIFGMLSLQIGYRILNCIINFLVLHFWFLSFAWGPLKFFSKSFFVAVFVSYAHSYLEFVCVGRYFYWSSFLGVV